MENTWKKFSGHLIHVRKHEQHPLRCRIGGSEGTTFQSTVEGTGSTAFRLHFYYMYRIAENILLAVGSPFVHHFGHRGGRGNRVNCSYFSKSVRNIRCRSIPVHSFCLSQREHTPFQCNGCLCKLS